MHFHYLPVIFLAVFVVVGCGSSTEMTERDTYQGEQLARPDRMIVHDFVADPRDVPPNSAFATYTEGAEAPTPEELEVATKVGAEIARLIVEELNDAGLPAVRAAGQPAPLDNDVVVRGYFISVYEGSAAKRIVVGFGAGDAEVTTAAEAYHMTPQGLSRIGGGKFKTGGGDMPGAVVPVAVFAATANPIGLIVGGAVKGVGEAADVGTMTGSVEANADEIAEQLKEGARSQGWI